MLQKQKDDEAKRQPRLQRPAHHVGASLLSQERWFVSGGQKVGLSNYGALIACVGRLQTNMKADLSSDAQSCHIPPR